MAGEGSIQWLGEVAAAAWIKSRLHPFNQDVDSVVPGGFQAYGRLFHPAEAGQPGGRRRSWDDVARENGRVVHPDMQFHMISRPLGTPAPLGGQRGDGPSWGSLPRPERQVLAEVLREYTGTPERCWFCLWDGYGGTDDQDVDARVELPQRKYFLYQGTVETALAMIPQAWYSRGGQYRSARRTTRRGLGGLWSRLGRRHQPEVKTPLAPYDQAPNLWWPDDRAWVVATDVDYAWTYIGGTSELIDRLLSDDRLEVLPAKLTDKAFYDSDVPNAALDARTARP
jgi:hypothetical protein